MRKYFYLLALFMSSYFINAQSNTDQLINDALIKAKSENKHVFVNYIADNGELSKKMQQQMNNEACKPLYNSNYVVVTIVVSKEEADEYVNCSNPFKSFSESNCEKIVFPFWYVLDDSGYCISDSYRDTKENMSYPSTKEKVESFVTVIRNTSKLTTPELDIIADTFHKMNNEQFYSSKTQ
ncbi:hypothetical protein [Tenacibaculum amylolyticum]|uniref:hypothetical protein n=1 Tax=Tenacibaculum amylolyticum TaxID=104269 RepID=UPI003893EF76